MSSFSSPLRPSDHDKNESDHIDGLFHDAVAANTNQHNIENKAVVPMSKLPDSSQTTKLLAQEMNGLSIKEREKIYENIHGVTVSTEEDPDFEAQNLELMERELQKIREKNAFDMAMAQSSSYVCNLYLRFLRSTSFEVKKAATKLVLFLEIKLELFGAELIGKRIGYDDLSLLDQKCVDCGWFQVLPYRDRAGRTVVWQYSPARMHDIPSLHNARALYYLSMLIADDEETQKRGAVAVVFPNEGANMNADAKDFAWKSARFTAALPIKVEGHHICLESKLLLPMIQMCVACLGKEVRLRTRIHQGTLTENSYTLMTFGIPVAYLPVSSSGKVKLKYFQQWLSRQFRLEQIRRKIPNNPGRSKKQHNNYNDDDDGPGIELPLRNDILIGTGVVAQSYSGNVQFLVLTANYHEQYTKSKMGEKKKIVEELYDLLHSKEYSARFLIRCSADDWWRVAPREVALKKIAHRLRAKQPPKSLSRELSTTTATTRQKNRNNIDSENGDAMDVGTTFLNDSRGGACDNNCCRADLNASNKRMRNS